MLSKLLRTNLRTFAFSIKKPQISSDHRKIYEICLPQKQKYITNGIITLLHSCLFMYLPKIYTDINYLIQLKVSNIQRSVILSEYAMVMGKWSVIFGLIGVFTYWRRYDFLDISNRIGIRMRTIAFKKIMESDLYKKNALFQTYLHHMITDIQNISNFTGQAVFMGLRGLFFLVGSTACLLVQSPLICLIAAVTMTAFNLFYRPRNIKLKSLKQQQNQKLIQLSQHIAQRLYNIRLVKICHTEAVQKLKLNTAINQFYQFAKKVAKANGFNYASLQSLGLFSLFTIVAGGSLLISLQISNFSLIASSTYALYASMGFRSLIFFNTELMKIMGIYKIIQQKIGSIHMDPDYCKSINQINIKYLQQVKQIQQQSRAIKQLKSSGISIRIQNLCFDYGDNNNNGSSYEMYKNYNQNIQAGDVVALVGPSGVGKSTLLNLITKLSDPKSGNIFLDDMPMSLMTFQDIQHKISYVTQQNFLFKGTLQQNLIYGNHGFDCSPQNLINCLKLTNAYDFTQKKGGLSMIIQAKGSNLSGGQKQRIIMARALVKHPRLLLLDQATAGVDSQSQKIIIQNLRKSRQGMTTIIITHKLQNFRPIITKIIQLKGKK